MLQPKHRVYATMGTVAGLIAKFREEQEFSERSEYWLKRTEEKCREYLLQLPKLPDSELEIIKDALERFFETVFEKGRTKHLMTFFAFFIAILDDLRLRDDRMKKILEVTVRADSALAAQYRTWPTCTVAGAKIADKWGEIWEQ